VEKKDPTGAKVTKAAAKKKWFLNVVSAYAVFQSLSLFYQFYLHVFAGFIMLNLQTWVLDRRWSISFLFVLDGIVFGFNSVS
jgi:hypothetical protein